MLAYRARKQVKHYVKVCQRQARPIIYTEMISIFMHSLSEKNVCLDIYKTTKQRDILKECADICCGLWRMLCTIDKQRMEYLTSSFQLFVVATLYLMKDGYIGNVKVFDHDMYLSYLLPSANALHLYQIQKGHFTTMKNNIQAIVRKGVESKRISATHLEKCMHMG